MTHDEVGIEKAISIYFSIMDKIETLIKEKTWGFKKSMNKKPNYCTQNNGNCKTCSLVNYGRDCINNLVKLEKTTTRSKIETIVKEKYEGQNK